MLNLTLRNITSQDLFLIHTISDPRIAPDGTILYTQKEVTASNTYTSFIARAHFDEPLKKFPPFTYGPEDSSPCISPNGKLVVFIRKENLFVIPLDGGEAAQLTCFKNLITGITWRPDGKALAFTALVPSEGLTPESQETISEKTEDDLDKIKVIKRLNYRIEGVGYVHDRWNQLFELELATKKIRQLTFGEYDCYSPRYCSDEKSILVKSNREPEVDLQPFQSYIYQVFLENQDAPKNLTPGITSFYSYTLSHDGQWIACIGIEDASNPYQPPGLWIISFDGKVRERMTDPDLCIGNFGYTDLRTPNNIENIQWTSDDASILVNSSDRGRNCLISVNRETKKLTRFGQGAHHIYDWDMDENTGKIVAAFSTPTLPNDLAGMSLSDPQLKRLTNVNEKFLSSVQLAQPEAFSVRSDDNTKIEGWIVKPPDFEEEKRYPAILNIHGGPTLMFPEGFWFEIQLLAAHGYIVIFANPRGTLGFGKDFSEALRGKWGIVEFQDLMAIMRETEKISNIDQEKLGLLGHSAGGYEVNWIITQTNKFKAVVTMSCISNLYSFEGTWDGMALTKLETQVEPWENVTPYLQSSPLHHALTIDKSVHVLILHGEDDLRCPISQAEEFFSALKKLKIDTKFVRFPGGHSYSRVGPPKIRKYSNDLILEWFDEHLKIFSSF